MAASAAVHVSSNCQEVLIVNKLAMAGRLHLRHKEGILNRNRLVVALLFVMLRDFIFNVFKVYIKRSVLMVSMKCWDTVGSLIDEGDFI